MELPKAKPNTPKPVLLVRLKGGLGNQMFQYATARSLSLEHDMRLMLDATGYDDARVALSDTPRKLGLTLLNVQAEIASESLVRSVKYPYGTCSKILRAFRQKILGLTYPDYHPEIRRKAAKRKDFYLDGYFQSEKNFSDISELLRSELVPRAENLSPAFHDLSAGIQALPAAVSMHIRRGDYVTDARTNAHHGTCSPEYYRQAMRGMRSLYPDATFVFFSDDMDWVKREFPEAPDRIYVSGDGLKDFEEMRLMSLCSHNVIANSSFSWWGAWLNRNPDKMVFAPARWNASGNPHPNVIPATWTKI